ncbi:class I SAM-dependent methyltransferase [Falsigemmobacter intermedius]|uniref:Class I SAM-dependent methyltransferase n=1 Tax=Falsigemmobacter intermedius TaxID=1553448 RepID=A0A3S3VWS6_9RHOB|nr:SAM-dependent methyltransferase [Falsigemmobacter intermedius]RWY43497.1 class I SAM-dependent methyltransferase [Falsigemmobacter intermedius]
MSTPLAALLKARIAASGPMRLSDYMAECLLHPEYGYYTRTEPFGRGGDFITAPEISQMFGELLGLWLAQCWLDQGAPGRFTLAEAGPGRGTLMADILRATRGVPGFHQAMAVHLVEASPRLRQVQREALRGYDVIWAESLADLPQAPLWFVANEFFDALPVRQFIREPSGWSEAMVVLEGDRLAHSRSAPRGVPALAHRLGDTRAGDVVELCPAARPLTEAVAGRIARHGGAALIVDYGDWRSRGDTLQAMKAHGYAGLFDSPGEADLTAHVDFEPLALEAEAAGLRAYGPIPQGDLLRALGIEARAARLAERLSGDKLQNHLAATRRLTDAAEMGTLFKALALLPTTAPCPAGFTP